MASYGRNIESFCVLPGERRLVAGNVLGHLLVVGVDDLRIQREVPAHAGMVIAVDAHPELPYVCALGVDHAVSVWRVGEDGALARVLEANLRLPRPENGHEFPPSTSVSQAVAFHPTERRLLTRTANGAVAEIGFDDTGFEFVWCRAFFPGRETGYVRYLVDPERILVSAGDGTLGVFDVRDRARPLFEYRYNHEQIHAAEHLEGDEYLLASDSRRVIRIDLSGAKRPVVGPTIVRDHLERVDYNRRSGRAFVSSFDRCLYEVRADTGEAVRTVARTPMKCRWIESLEREPDTLIAQCRNGALYKFDLARREVTGVLKETPNALWCGAWRGDSLLLAGDGPELLRISLDGADDLTRAHRLRGEWLDVLPEDGAYVKRMALRPGSSTVYFGRVDGRVWSWDGRETRERVDLGSPIRDLAAAPEGDDLFAVTEDGSAHRIDAATDTVVASARSPRGEPYWSLAYNHERRLLAVAEREGSCRLLDAGTLSQRAEVPDVRRSKRARWIDARSLLVVSINRILQVDPDTRSMSVVVPSQRNTIEDFAWSHDRRYLAFVTYAQDVSVFDLASRTWVHSVTFDMHYPKGLEWLPPVEGAYPYEFVVWGRSGNPRHYRLHGCRIVPLEQLAPRPSRVDQRAGVVAL